VNESTPASNDRRTARVLWIVLGLNALVAASKLGVGYEFDLVSLVADGMHSVLDGSSNVVGLVGLSLAARPPDAGHPYGHRRFESLAALAIGGLISAAFFEIALRVYDAFTADVPAPEVSWGVVAVVATTIVVNVGISRYESRQGRLLGSALLEADAAHTRSDALAATAVLASFAGIALGFKWADGVGAAVVSIFVGKTAWSVVKSSVLSLVDSVQLAPEEVLRVTLEVQGVLGAHKIRSRGERNAVHLDLHIQLDGNLTLVEAHSKTHEVKAHLMSHFPRLSDVVIHTEPSHFDENNPAPLMSEVT
jgi:cation diffusion facilitator family transporter